MEFPSPAVLLSGVVISSVGLGVFIYGKRMQSLKSLAVGAILMAFPLFVPSVLWMWLAAGACMGGLYLLRQEG